ncbi:GGDEF domain-containing protein [Tropicibacter sp. S64]|uniref:GGDEF domain-containing protein n=1 Tax=Tropicibacter sp. S64 TaxID=3415122 RepID=UPI003C7D7832
MCIALIGQLLPLALVVCYLGFTAGARALASAEFVIFFISTGAGMFFSVTGLSALMVPLRTLEQALSVMKARREYRVLPTEFRDSVGRMMAVTNAIAQALGAKLDPRYAKSNINPLTGVLDEAGFEVALRRQGEGTLVWLNIDNLEGIRAEHGAELADALLAQAGQALRDELRIGDLVGHTGETEMGVWLKGAGRVVSRHVAERLCDAVKMATVRELPGVTLSAGIAVRGEKEPVEALLPRAEDAWRMAHHSGNRVELAPNVG